ncbi:MAG: hypothetical protein WKG07_04750 [Hymenobacter sp.]
MKNNRLLYILLGLVVVLIAGYAVAKKQGWIGKPTGTEVTAAKAGPSHHRGKSERLGQGAARDGK